MIAHKAYQLAIRAQLVTLVVCTTGAVQLAATATGYVRTAGSFLADGFEPGMQLVANGFTTPGNNGARTITAVDALTITCAGCTPEATNARTLTVTLPADAMVENVDFVPTPGRPFWVEQYLPGPAMRDSIGPFARLTAEPMYAVQLYVPANTGRGAATAYADALLALFAPGLEFAASNGDVIKVRGDQAPFRSPLTQGHPGFAVVTVTIPFRCHSLNSI